MFKSTRFFEGSQTFDLVLRGAPQSRRVVGQNPIHSEVRELLHPVLIVHGPRHDQVGEHREGLDGALECRNEEALDMDLIRGQGTVRAGRMMEKNEHPPDPRIPSNRSSSRSYQASY